MEEADWKSYEMRLRKLSQSTQRVLAMRSALRSLPYAIRSEAWQKRSTRVLALTAFRAGFISWASMKYAATNLIERHQPAIFAIDSAIESVRFTAHSIEVASAVSSGLEAARSAAFSLADSASFAARQSTISAADSARSSARHAASSGDSNHRSARVAALNDLSVAESLDEASTMLKCPLWIGDQSIKVDIFEQLTAAKQLFSLSIHSEVTQWNLWMVWWENLQANTSRSLFGEAKDNALAKQDGSFWGDDLDEPDPDAVMVRVAELVGWPFPLEQEDELGQGLAAYTFEETEHGITARPLQTQAFDETLASDLHAALLDQLSRLKDRIKRTQAPRRIAATIDRLLAVLGNSLSDVRPGSLLPAARALEADTATYEQEEALKEVDAEVVSMMAEAHMSLDDFISVFPQLADLNARTLAVRLQSANVEQAIIPLAETVSIAKSYPLVLEPAIAAIEESAPLIATFSEQIADARNEDIRGKAIKLRAEVAAAQMLVTLNFVSKIARSVKEGSMNLTKDELRTVKDILDGKDGAKETAALKVALVGLLYSLIGPIGLLAALHTPYSRLKAIAQRILDDLFSDDGEDDSGTDVDGNS